MGFNNSPAIAVTPRKLKADFLATLELEESQVKKDAWDLGSAQVASLLLYTEVSPAKGDGA